MNVTFEDIADAIVNGKYVEWQGPWSSGLVVGITPGRMLTMQALPLRFKPIKSSVEQSVANGYVFTILGSSVDDFVNERDSRSDVERG